MATDPIVCFGSPEEDPDPGGFPSRQELVVQYLPAIRKEARRIYESRPRHAYLEVEDLVSFGVLAAIRASRSWDPGRNVGFGLYMMHFARGAMLDLYRRKKLIDLQSYDAVGNGADLEKCAPCAAACFEPEVIRRQEQRLAVELMQGLPEIEQDVLREVYFRNASARTAARRLKITEDAVEEVRASALASLRARMRKGCQAE